MNYGVENLNDLYLLIYKNSDHIQRPVSVSVWCYVVDTTAGFYTTGGKILIFFTDLPVR